MWREEWWSRGRSGHTNGDIESHASFDQIGILGIQQTSGLSKFQPDSNAHILGQLLYKGLLALLLHRAKR